MSMRPLMAALACAVLTATGAGGCRRAAPLDSVTIAVPYGPRELWSHTSADEVTNSVLRNAYEPLVDISAELRLLPCLAQSWHNPDDLTWEFRLRPDVRLHDGSLLQAAQVAAFFQRVFADPQTLRSPGHLIEAAEAESPDVVRLRTRRPVGWLPSQLARLLIGVDGGGAIPLGTGPYRVVRWEPGGAVELAASDLHRDGAPAISQLAFAPIASPSEAVRRLRAREVHLLAEPSAEAWPALQADPELRTFERPSLRVVFLGINSLPNGEGNRALRDVRVRRALRRAIDPGGLLAPLHPAPGVVARELVPPELVGAHGNLSVEPADPEQARQMLAQAGYRDGLDLTLEFEAGRYPGVEQLVTELAAQLGRAGVRITARPRPAASRFQSKGVDLFVLGWLHSSGDAAAGYEYLVHSPTTQGRGGLSAFSNPEVDALLARAALPVPGEERQRLLRSVAEIIHEDVALVPLYRTFDRYAFDARLLFSPRLDRRIRGQDLRPAPR